MKSRINFPVLALREYGVVMKRLSGALGFSESEISRLRLRCIELLEKHGFSAVRTAYPSVGRAVYIAGKLSSTKKEEGFLRCCRTPPVRSRLDR